MFLSHIDISLDVSPSLSLRSIKNFKKEAEKERGGGGEEEPRSCFTPGLGRPRRPGKQERTISHNLRHPLRRI